MVEARQVIDGQQRLTTLQVLLAALRDRVQATGATLDQRVLEKLTRNDHEYIVDEDERFRVWPTNLDRDVFPRWFQDVDHWDEDAIERRARVLFDLARRIWVRPGQEEPVETPAARERQTPTESEAASAAEDTAGLAAQVRANLEAIVAEEACEKAKDFCGIFAERHPGDVARLARSYAKSPRYTWRVYMDNSVTIRSRTV